MTATLDAIDDAGDVWEYKSAGFQTAAPLLDGVNATLPAPWIIQCHHQMVSSNKPRVRFAVFVGHRLQLFRFCVERDQEIIDSIIPLLIEFRRHIEDCTPPQDFDPEDAALLLKHYSKINGEVLELDQGEFGESAEIFKDASLQIKMATASKNKAKAELLGAMKEAEYAKVGPYELRRQAINVKAQPPKPKAAYSYIKFGFSGLDEE